uniref:Uncharacterized protein n=1 Tax=Arundo donax TaxID=35708 RepID=A0A0A9APR8_ARUDO
MDHLFLLYKEIMCSSPARSRKKKHMRLPKS